MTILEEYRRNAQECQRMAENAGNAIDKASWLRLASSWLTMIKNNPTRLPGGNGDEAEGQANHANSQHAWPDPTDKDSRASH